MCQCAVTLLNGHYLCISMVLLTVGACVQHTRIRTVAVMNRLLAAQRQRKRAGERVTCQCSWHFAQRGAIKAVYLVALSDGSNSLEILQDLLPAKHLTGGLSEHSTETLLRSKHCSGQRMTSFPILCSLLEESSATVSCHSFIIFHCGGDNTHPEWPEVTMLLWRLVY